MTQQSIDQEIYRQRLIDYVKANSNKNEQQAIDYLDQNCPAWRQGVVPCRAWLRWQKQEIKKNDDHLYRRANVRHQRL